jgi:hypothetical protein
MVDRNEAHLKLAVEVLRTGFPLKRHALCFVQFGVEFQRLTPSVNHCACIIMANQPLATPNKTKRKQSANSRATATDHPLLRPVLDDLVWYCAPGCSGFTDSRSSRFVINCPKEELETPERIGWQFELAHWYYEDFYRASVPELPSFGLGPFVTARMS